MEYNAAVYRIVMPLKFHVFLSFLADLLEELINLNLVFQRRKVDLTVVQSLVRCMIIFICERGIDYRDHFVTLRATRQATSSQEKESMATDDLDAILFAHPGKT
ncbi:unnamed protein product [Closterium sp. Naga37s-1]|nr:unnamed protein product [Closterium sp. Naga37s-1]